MDTTLATLRERVLDAASTHTPLRIAGGGSKSFYAPPTQGQLLDVTKHSGIVSYEPTELVITAKCGTPLLEIEAALAEHQQSLAFEPPLFSPNTTFGGMIAAGLSGPARAAVGSVRDFVLGTQLLDGRGQILNFGGVVMKNVAGYDVSRLLTGSMGHLGVITQASIKVWPKPKVHHFLQLECNAHTAITTMNTWAGQPLPITGTVWQQGVLTIRLGGAQAAIQSAINTMGARHVELEAGYALFDSLRHQTHPFFAARANTQLMRVSVPSTSTASMSDPTTDDTLIEWGGALRWVHSANPAQTSAQAVTAGGHATIWRPSPTTALELHTPLNPVTADIERRLRQEFDPHSIFNQSITPHTA